MNTHLQYAGAIYALYVAVFFFLKKKTKSLENKIYGGMIIHTIFMFIFNIGSRVVPTKFPLTFPPVFILTKINFCLLMGYFIRFSLYIFTMTSDKNIEFTEISEHPNKEYFKKKAILMRIATIISCILMIALPFEISVTEDRLIFLTGPVVIAQYIIMSLCILSWIIMMIKAKEKAKNLKTIYFYIFLAILTVILQITVQGVDFIPVFIGLITVLIYNTIENPDVNLIKELKQAKKAADEANKSKTEFLSRMSHEIRTPLNAIVGFGQALTKENIQEDAKEEVADILMASNTLLDIVNGILDIQKIESNKVEIINDDYATKRMVNEVTSLINARIGSKPINFKILIDEKLPAVLYGDVIRVKQIMINLLTNAIKYTNEGRILFQIKATNENGICNMLIEVTDTGMGMTQESIDKLFSRYERFDLENNINTEGTGLGMAITKGLVELMNGDIQVKSKYGEGTTFLVTIKQKIVKEKLDEIEDIEPITEIKAFNASGSKVLVVDDNKINIKVAERLLREYNISVESVTSGAESIDLVLNGKKYDIIFMDIMMPKMNGIEALQNLRSIVGFNMPVVALTADVISGMEEKYISQGFDDCLAKPIVEEELYYMLKKYLREKQPTTQPIIESQTIATPAPAPAAVVPAEPVVAPAPAPAPVAMEPVAVPVEAQTPEVVQPQQTSNLVHNVEYLEQNKISVASGLELLKDMEMYNMTLEEFYNELQNKLKDLKEYKETGNMEDYAILAHALKTEARYVGCNELGDMAYEHELAGKESNQNKINEKFEELTSEANRVYEIIKIYFGN